MSLLEKISSTVLPGGWRRVITAALICACLWVVTALLYASYCALLNHEFDWDYSIYFNMIWNSAHGDWFKFMVDDNYLLTHLSFSLILLAPLLHLFDHPFTLYCIQLLFILGGGAFIAVTGRRHGLSWIFVLSIILFYLGYHFTQTTQLDEFHGVAVYFLLIPWLYHCLCYRKGQTWIPFIIILGLREDAAFMILPLLLYMAFREKWKAGYAYSLIGLIYGIAALVILYAFVMKYAPQAHNLTFVRPPSILDSFGETGLKMRANALFWVALPIIPFLIRGSRPILIISSAAIIVSMCSAQWRQFSLAYHYPAVIMACLAVGMLESARQKKYLSDQLSRLLLTVIPIYLVAVTAFSYYRKGHLPGSKPRTNSYLEIDATGQRALWIARNQIPAEGLLFTVPEWAAFVANRRHLITPETIRKDRHPVDIAFLGTPDVVSFGYLPLLQTGEYGVRFHDNIFFVLQKGFDTSKNNEAIELLKNPTVPLAWTLKHAGETIYHPDVGLVRFWKGGLEKGAITVAHGVPLDLEPGEYQAVFRLQNGQTSKPHGRMGTLSLHERGKTVAITSAPVEQGPAGFHTQTLTFKLEQKTLVEPRVEGAAAQLWLDCVTFRKAGPAAP